MEDLFSGNGYEYGGLDPQREALRFEEHMAIGEPLFMDIVTIEEVFEYYRMADEHEKATKLLDFGLSYYPYHAGLYYRKAALLYDKEQYPEALGLLEQGLSFQPSDRDARILQAKIYAQLGRLDDALEILESALDLSEDTAEVYYQLGQLCQNDARYMRAITFYSRAIDANPDYEDALFEIVYCYEKVDKLEAAVRFTERYLARSPYSSCGWYNLGLLRNKFGLFEQAIEAFDYAIVIQEDFISAYYAMATSQMELDKYDAAVRTLLTSLSHDRHDIATQLCLGECYEHLLDYPRARFYYRKATELFPNLPDAWYGMGSAFEAEGRYLEAIHHYKKALEYNPEYFDAWLGMADSEYYLGNDYHAFEALQKAIALQPEDMEMWRSWGERLYDDNGPEQARLLLEEALRHNPHAPALLYQYGSYAVASGKRQDGITALENALILAPEDKHLVEVFCPHLLKLESIAELLGLY